jgi:hypothetical protein
MIKNTKAKKPKPIRYSTLISVLLSDEELKQIYGKSILDEIKLIGDDIPTASSPIVLIPCKIDKKTKRVTFHYGKVSDATRR